MKYYTLQAIINGERKAFPNKFSSRDSAINFMFNYLDHAFIYNKSIDEEYAHGNNKHEIEYVCDQNTRFIINRVVC